MIRKIVASLIWARDSVGLSQVESSGWVRAGEGSGSAVSWYDFAG